jgi:hypothetical protein
MRHIRTRLGPFSERPHFKFGEIEEICTDALKQVGLYPSVPQPIRIDRFVEKRFGRPPDYQDLPDGVLGYTKFGAKGVELIIVSTALDQGGGMATERRLRSTLAHEGGHGLLHAHLFHLGEKPPSMFEETHDKTPHILCRDMPDATPAARGYDGRWWEFQANKAIGGLLLPRPLVEIALEKFYVNVGLLGHRALPPEKRETASPFNKVLHALLRLSRRRTWQLLSARWQAGRSARCGSFPTGIASEQRSPRGSRSER